MLINLTVLTLLLCILIPFGCFLLGRRTKRRFKLTLGVNIITFFSVLFLASFFLFSGRAFAAEEAAAAESGLKFIAAAVSTGLGSIGAGIAVAAASSSAIGAISENEGIFGKTLVFVGLAEGIAIYGFLISLMILFS